MIRNEIARSVKEAADRAHQDPVLLENVTGKLH